MRRGHRLVPAVLLAGYGQGQWGALGVRGSSGFGRASSEAKQTFEVLRGRVSAGTKRKAKPVMETSVSRRGLELILQRRMDVLGEIVPRLPASEV